MALKVNSEIGLLRRVLIHRPGLEIDRMVPTMMEHLLFDDILDGEEARQEHDIFCEVLEAMGVETVDAQLLLADVLERAEPREDLFAGLVASGRVAERALDRLRELEGVELAEALIAGVLGERTSHGNLFELLPVPNYFFQRDPQIVVGDRVVVSSMATEARERESLLSKIVFRYHEALSGYRRQVEIHSPPHAAPDIGPAYPFPTLEGGDILVAAPEILLVGISERTNRRGVEVLAETLRREDTSFRHLLAIELPSRRAYMHLDTVFTIVDHHACLAYPAVIGADGPEAARVYSVNLFSDELTFTLQPSLLRALADRGLELDMIPCGGNDLIDQEREQWTDGANAFAVAPGVIFFYQRNRKTAEELERRGWRVLTHRQALESSDLRTGGPTAVVFSGHELSRARGGPRCMTMPLEREDL